MSRVIDVYAITLFPFVFLSVPIDEISDRTRRHETIHLHQQREFLILFMILGLILSVPYGLLALIVGLSGLPLYYILYGLFYLKGLWNNRKVSKTIRREFAYLDIPFEKEAYDFQSEIAYPARRLPFAWIVYIFFKE